jgi:hypothetical protein
VRSGICKHTNIHIYPISLYILIYIPIYLYTYIPIYLYTYIHYYTLYILIYILIYTYIHYYTGVSVQYIDQTELHYLWPLNGPALRGGTILNIHGVGFEDDIDLSCIVDMTPVQAIFISPTQVQCRIPPHRYLYVIVLY